MGEMPSRSEGPNRMADWLPNPPVELRVNDRSLEAMLSSHEFCERLDRAIKDTEKYSADDELTIEHVRWFLTRYPHDGVVHEALKSSFRFRNLENRSRNR